MKIIGASLMALIATVALNVHAVTIDLTHSQPSVQLGDDLRLNVLLGGLTGTALGSYDFNLNYDPSLVIFQQIIWGDPSLGDQLDLSGEGSLKNAETSVPGNLNIWQLSLDEVSVLNELQAKNFIAFSVVFDSILPGPGQFSLEINSMGDAYGNHLASELIAPLELLIKDVSVPEPQALLLLVGALAVVALRLSSLKSHK